MTSHSDMDITRRIHRAKPHPSELYRPKFKVSEELDYWVRLNASLPNKSMYRKVRGWPVSGMRCHEDEYDVVYGRVVERTKQPLFGNPTAMVNVAINLPP